MQQWVIEYEVPSALHDRYRARKPTCPDDQKRAAAVYYSEHGRGLRATIRALGYPNRETLRHWLDELVDDSRILCSGKPQKPPGKLTDEQKQATIADFCLREGQAKGVAAKHGVTQGTLYKWKSDLFGRGTR